jgi:DNA-binding response OmpR family regulator
MKKILIVEDDKFLRELMAQKLAKEGYDVIEAIDGEDALKSIKEEKPDLVLLDLILPGKDGFEVLAKVKEDAALSKIPIIVLSNLGQKEDVERALNLGATDYMVKAHFTPGEIIAKIKGILE